MIGIDKCDDLINNGFYLWPGEIPAYAYAFTQPFGDQNSHLSAIPTVAARRLIVTSPKMSNSDAYYLRSRVLAALPDDKVSRRDKDGRWPGPIAVDAQRGVDHPLCYPLHEGVELDPDSGPGFSWFGRNAT